MAGQTRRYAYDDGLFRSLPFHTATIKVMAGQTRRYAYDDGLSAACEAPPFHTATIKVANFCNSALGRVAGGDGTHRNCIPIQLSFHGHCFSTQTLEFVLGVELINLAV